MMPDPIGQAARWLGSGGLLAYPTETVWGLAVDARSPEGFERLRRWKGRGKDEPLALLVDGVENARELGCELGPAAERLAAAFWPGPLTLVVPCSRHSAGGSAPFADGVARSDGAVGLRCSSHPLAGALARRLRREAIGPVTATSLNRSQAAAAATRAEAAALCGDGPDEPRLLPVEGAEAGGGDASTVIDCTGEVPEVLRWGALAESELAPRLRELAIP